MAGKFDITKLMGGANTQARAGQAAEQETPIHQTLKVIPININDLIPSTENFYSVENITELKAAIEMFGVIQPLAVKPLDGGKYRIIAGHRRHRACTELVSEGKREFEYIPCGIQAERDEIKERILLIMTNSTTRELSDWEKMKQAEELQKYFSVLKKRDNLPGRVRDLVAEALNTSSTQIARMNAISNNLAPELKDEFQAGRLGLSAAYELSGLPEEKQREAAAEIQEKGGLSLNDVKEKKQESTTADINETESVTQTQSTEMRDRFMESMGQQPTPRAEPKDYPESPPDFEEGQEDSEEDNENQDFADMSAEDKAEAAIAFLNSKRFNLFAPGEDTRVLDFIIETLESYTEMRGCQ